MPDFGDFGGKLWRRQTLGCKVSPRAPQRHSPAAAVFGEWWTAFTGPGRFPLVCAGGILFSSQIVIMLS